MMTAFPSLLLATMPYPSCPDGLACSKLAPSDLPGMVFDCAHIESKLPGSAAGNVYLMHGDDGLQSKAMWAETMTQLADKGYDSLACDQRGYSPGAAPDEMSAYSYDLLASDIVSITNAFGFNASFGGKFHLVAHDQGARIGWHSIAKGAGRKSYLSFSTLSIPHADVFNERVCCGAGTVASDQTAEQYLRQLLLPGSVRINNNALFVQFCETFGFVAGQEEACQKSFWWYNGAVDSGAMAVAPLMPFGDSIASEIKIPYDQVKNLTQYPLDGVAQTAKVGIVREFPVMFACSTHDTCDLCTQAGAEESGKMVTSNFTFVSNTCHHQLIRVSDCPIDQRQKVIQAIIANVVNAPPRPTADTGTGTLAAH